MKRTIPILASIAAAILLVWSMWFWVPGPPGDGIDRALDLAARPAGGDFRLTAKQGPVDLADLRGQVVLIYFGYTLCPDICPTNLAFIARALETLTPAEREQVRVLFVSVDPQRDTPERLAAYVAYFHPRILGVTGSEAEIAAAARLYGATYRRHEDPDSAMGYSVDHSAFSYLVDPQGRLVRTLDHATPAAEIVVAIRALLPPAAP